MIAAVAHSHLLLLGAIAAVATLLATPIAAWAARRLDVMDRPDQFLKPHARATPYLGGVAIFAGWVLAAFTATWAARIGSAAPTPALLSVVAGGFAIMLIGLADDVGRLSPLLRLALSAGLVAGVMLASGAGLRTAEALATPLGLSLPPAVATAASLALGVFIVLGACNATNLIDGLDGLCAGVIAVIAVGFTLLSAALAATAPADPGHAARLALSVATAGACLGFLPWNFHPARIFMGDAGSMLLGYSCGMLILLVAQLGEAAWLAAGIVMFGLPIFDTALAMIRRWRAGKPIFEGDRSHFYDRLVQRGWSVRATALICYACAAGFVAAGLALGLIRRA